MGVEPEMEWALSKVQKVYSPNMDLDPELTLNNLRWDIDGTQARTRVDPKLS